MLHGLEILDGLRARQRFERDATSEAERAVQERLREVRERG